MADRRIPHVSNMGLQDARRVALSDASVRNEEQTTQALATLVRALDVCEAKIEHGSVTALESDLPRGMETRNYTAKIFRIADWLRIHRSDKITNPLAQDLDEAAKQCNELQKSGEIVTERLLLSGVLLTAREIKACSTFE